MKAKIFFLFFLLLSLLILSFFVGTSNISLLNHPMAEKIFWDIRFPRSMSILFVGLSLGLSGQLLQSLLRNPLAEPYTLGISGGASLGLCISLLLPVSPLWLTSPLFSSIGCLISSSLVFGLAKGMGKWNQKNLLLSGVLISFLASSITFVFLSILSPHDLQKALAWMIGSFGHERDTWWPILAIPFFFFFIYCFKQAKRMDYFLLGEEISSSFLKNPERFRLTLLIFTCLLVSISVSLCGMLAFLGLLAPHMSHFYLKSMRSKNLLIGSSVLGSILLFISDIFSRLLTSLFYIPSGIFIAIVGAPFMIYFLSKESQNAPL